MLEKDPQIHCVFITTHWTKVNKVKKVSFKFSDIISYAVLKEE